MIPDLPDFLRIPQDGRRAAWKGRRLTDWSKVNCAKQTKVEEAATRQLRRELEKQAADKRAARFAMLKERFGR